ncbi:MAG: FliM/FliN family flagellar motor switch protein [Candidatus Tumulicola sp.]
MRSLTFGVVTARAGVRIRDARFEERSSLPVSAACVVAAGVRETLAALLGVAVAVRLLEPVIPTPEAWAAIARGAMLYRFHGSVADAIIVLRPRDAGALAAAAFGEPAAASTPERELSPLEREVLDRAVSAVAGTLNAVCGARERDVLERVQTIGAFVTYFEVVLEQSVDARIGIAVSRDPAPEPHGRLEIGDLGDICVAPVVSLDMTAIEAGALAQLKIGALLAIPLASGFRGRLHVGGRTLARGTCGTYDGRYALAVESVP